MKSITHFPDSIHEYAQKGKENIFPVITGCPCCDYEGKLHCHGFYERNVITFARDYRIFIARKICPVCSKTVSQIPDFLIPYFQYSYQTILTLLTYMFIDRLTFLHILNKIGQRNSLAISMQHLSFYRKRFIQSRFSIHLFFATLSNPLLYFEMNIIALEPLQVVGSLMKKIQIFSGLYHNFNISYFEKMYNNYFFSPIHKIKIKG